MTKLNFYSTQLCKLVKRTNFNPSSRILEYFKPSKLPLLLGHFLSNALARKHAIKQIRKHFADAQERKKTV